KDE
ncbi:A32.5L, partial [Monkeypox virus]